MSNIIITKKQYEKLIKNGELSLTIGDGVVDHKAKISVFEVLDDKLFELEVPSTKTCKLVNVKYED